MNIKKYAFLAALLFCTAAVCDRVEAKELIIHMGYEMIQVIDADTDEITNIPMKGASRDSVFSADRMSLYITGSRTVILTRDL
jgi:hypothetical protein